MNPERQMNQYFSRRMNIFLYTAKKKIKQSPLNGYIPTKSQATRTNAIVLGKLKPIKIKKTQRGMN